MYLGLLHMSKIELIQNCYTVSNFMFLVLENTQAKNLLMNILEIMSKKMNISNYFEMYNLLQLNQYFYTRR